MADKQIEEFPIVPTPDSGDVFHLSRGGADRSILVENLVPAVGTSGTVIVNRFVDGTDYTSGSSNAISLSQSLVSKRNAWIFFDGVYQEKITYEISGNAVVFNSVIPMGVDSIEVVMPLVLNVDQTSADNVQFSTNGTVEDLLSQTIVFASVAEMSNAAWLEIGYKCSTLGYTTAGDGGDNDYQIVASGTGTDDGYEFIDNVPSNVQALGLFTKGHRSPKQGGATSNVASFPSGSATPSVERGDYYLTSGTTTITNFIDGREGQTIHLQATDNITVQNNSSIVLGDGNDYVMVTGDVLVLAQYSPSVWTEESRGSVGGGGDVTWQQDSSSILDSATANFTGHGPPGFLEVVDSGGVADVRVKKGVAFLPGDTDYVFGAEGGLASATQMVFNHDVGVISSITASANGAFGIGKSGASQISFSPGGDFIDIGAMDASGVESTISTSGGTVFAWSYDGTNTSVSLDHNGTPVLTVDETGFGAVSSSGAAISASVGGACTMSALSGGIIQAHSSGASMANGVMSIAGVGDTLTFFGAPSVVQQTIDSSDTDTNRIAAIEALLVAYGLADDIAP